MESNKMVATAESKIVTDASVTQDEPSRSRASSCRVVTDSSSFKGHPQNGGRDYFMDCEQRGWAYVFNLAGENGARDAERLEKTLRDTWYFYVVVQNCKDWVNVKEFMSIIEEKFTDTEDCLLIAVLYEEKYKLSDSVENLWKIFTKVNNKLVTKPKIFLFNEYVTYSSLQIDGINGNQTRPNFVPSHSDFLLIYGSGLEYIQHLCVEIDREPEDDVYNLISRANCSSSAHFTSTLLFTLRLTSSTKMALEQQSYSEKIEERKNEVNSTIVKDTTMVRNNLIEEIKAYREPLDEKDDASKNANRILKKLDNEDMTYSNVDKLKKAFVSLKSMENNLQLE